MLDQVCMLDDPFDVAPPGEDDEMRQISAELRATLIIDPETGLADTYDTFGTEWSRTRALARHAALNPDILRGDLTPWLEELLAHVDRVLQEGPRAPLRRRAGEIAAVMVKDLRYETTMALAKALRLGRAHVDGGPIDETTQRLKKVVAPVLTEHLDTMFERWRAHGDLALADRHRDRRRPASDRPPRQFRPPTDVVPR